MPTLIILKKGQKGKYSCRSQLYGSCSFYRIKSRVHYAEVRVRYRVRNRTELLLHQLCKLFSSLHPHTQQRRTMTRRLSMTPLELRARILETDPKVLRAPETTLAASVPAPVALPDEATSARPRCSHGQRQNSSSSRLRSQRVPAATQHHAAPFRSSISHPGHATLLALPALRKLVQRTHHPPRLRVYLLLPPQRAVVATIPECRPQGCGCCSIRCAGEFC